MIPKPTPQPRSAAGYSGTPLPQKLGIKPDSVTVLVNAPAGFERTLGALPKGAVLRRGAGGSPNLVIWFTIARRDLERRIGTISKLARGGALWIVWPKRASGVRTDLTETEVRAAGLEVGLVDYKVCAIDPTWSGLKFARRRS